MKKTLISIAVALGLILTPTTAHAGGSDSPTPYTVTAQGVFLPDGDVFTDGSHVNARNDKGQTFNIHFERKYADPSHAEWRNLPFNHQDPRNQFYGQSFLPWEALNGFDAKNEFCIVWVQVHGYNQHHGEGGQEPVGTGCTTPPDLIEPGEWSQVEFTCTTQVGDVLDRTRQVTITKYTWDGKVKSTETVTESGTYTVTEADLWGMDCRTDVIPVAPTFTKAYATCVAEESTYVPATVTLNPTVNGKWTPEGTFQLAQDGGEATFSVTDDVKYRVGAVADGEFWTVEQVDNTLVYTFTPNPVEDIEDCELAQSGMDGNAALTGATTFGVLALIGAGLVVLGRRRK